MRWLIRSSVAVVVGSVMLAASAGSARAQTVHTERRLRIADFGFRPLVSMPDALGVTAEVHPFGGNLAIEGGAGMSPVVAFTWTAAVKYRFVVYTGERAQLSVGPGVGSSWLFERGQPIDQQLLSGFVTVEAVWWRWWDDRVGFRLAMDAGVMHPIYDAPDGSHLGTTPVFNGSIGWAFRLGR
jgi:hypothetical protein